MVSFRFNGHFGINLENTEYVRRTYILILGSFSIYVPLNSELGFFVNRDNIARPGTFFDDLLGNNLEHCLHLTKMARNRRKKPVYVVPLSKCTTST